MISTAVALISLNLSLYLINAGQIAGSFPITAATQTTPIRITCTKHGVPLGRTVHGVVSGVVGETEANGLWIARPLDENTFALSTLTPDGQSVQSVGVQAYVSGGSLQYAFPDYRILLGRRNMALASAPATPRVVFIPTFEAEWGFEPYGGAGGQQDSPTQEMTNATLNPQWETEPVTFEIYVSGASNPPDPDAGDFDATQFVVHSLRIVMIDAFGAPRCRVLGASWISQLPPNHPLATGTQSQRGQTMMLRAQINDPVFRVPSLQYAPEGTSITFGIGTVPGGSSDDVVITVT